MPRAAASDRIRRCSCVAFAFVGLLLVISPRADAQDTIAITPPVIEGTARIGEVLRASAGDWEPPIPAIATYQWLRCPPQADCVEIPRATSRLAYRVTDDDTGHTLRIRLTVLLLDGGRGGSAESEPTAPVPPLNIERPSHAREAREGQLLTASPGRWSGTLPLSFGYEWQRCDPALPSCETIQGAVSASYTPSAADVGMTVRVVVTASVGGASTAAISDPTAAVRRAPPVNREPPVITGVAEVERSLVATPGRWDSSAELDFLYRWLRCNASGSRCDPIPGATGATYQVRMTDIGLALRVSVTAINDGGRSSPQESALSAVVPPPAGVQPFTQSGTPVVAPGAALMRPFPRVRIKGYLTSTGAVLQLVRVRGPARARIALACRGRGCPFRRRVRRGGPRVRLRSLERSYRAGVRLTIRITKPALIGKYTRIVIRAKRPPVRRDRCLLPGGDQPVQCPTAG